MFINVHFIVLYRHPLLTTVPAVTADEEPAPTGSRCGGGWGWRVPTTAATSTATFYATAATTALATRLVS